MKPEKIHRLMLLVQAGFIFTTGVALIQCIYISDVVTKMALATLDYWLLRSACKRFWKTYHTRVEWRWR